LAGNVPDGTNCQHDAASPNALPEVYPNPVAAATTVQFRAGQADQALVQVYKPLGQSVATRYNGPVEDGRAYQVPLAVQALTNVLYDCQLALGGTLAKRQPKLSTAFIGSIPWGSTTRYAISGLPTR
jgi:hypothetical protein